MIDTDTKIDRIKKWLNNEKTSPWHMQLQPTAKCNLKCRFCWSRKYTRKEKELSNVKWIEITREACEMGVRGLTIVGGGEPLVRLNLVKKMTGEIKKHNVNGTIVTNGTLFTNEFARHIVEICWDTIAVSIHGAKSSTDNYLRGNEKAFQMTMKSLEFINFWKQELNSNKPNIVFHSVITRQNINELTEILYLMKNVKAGTLVLRLVNDDLSDPQFYINKNQFNILCSQLENVTKLSKEFSIDLDWQMNIEDVKNNLFKDNNRIIKSLKEDKLEKKDKIIPCSRPFSEMVILPDGTIGPCCAFCEGKYSQDKNLADSVLEFVDNISDKSLQEIWMGKKFNKFREIVKKGQIPLYCKRTCPPDYVFLEQSGKILKH